MVSTVDMQMIESVKQVSSIGTDGTNNIPLRLLNTFGILNSKKRGMIMSIVRRRGRSLFFNPVPGRLVRGLETTVGMLRSDGPADCEDVAIAWTDDLIGGAQPEEHGGGRRASEQLGPQ